MKQPLSDSSNPDLPAAIAFRPRRSNSSCCHVYYGHRKVLRIHEFMATGRALGHVQVTCYYTINKPRIMQVCSQCPGFGLRLKTKRSHHPPARKPYGIFGHRLEREQVVNTERLCRGRAVVYHAELLHGWSESRRTHDWAIRACIAPLLRGDARLR